jgi:SPASM domain peptide maturase of grasp-with-spasm system
MKTYFKLFACCIPVKGFGRSVIYDVQRNAFEHIPNLLHELLQECRTSSIEELEYQYASEDYEGLVKFLNYLIAHEYGFWTTSPEEFPDMPVQWDYPGTISNAIVEYDTAASPYDLFALLRELDQLGCQYLQLRIFGKGSFQLLEDVASCIAASVLKVADIVIPCWDAPDLNAIFGLMKAQHRIIPLSLYRCPATISIPEDLAADKFLMSRLNISTQELVHDHVGEITNPDNFIVNVDFFMEAKGYNTGLNKKVCIDVAGGIKNHISHASVFGNLCTDALSETVGSIAFQSKWKMNNDKLEKCRDCEYRYMCLNNSDILFTEDGAAKQHACLYDPYTQEWMPAAGFHPDIAVK